MEAAVVALLAPFLPHLLKVGESLAEDAARALATEAGKHAKTLWARLRPRLEEQPGRLKPVSDVAAHPDDAAARGALLYQLREIFAGDAAFADEIRGLLETAERAGVVATSGGVAVGGNVVADRGSVGVIGTVGGDVRLPGAGDR